MVTENRIAGSVGSVRPVKVHLTGGRYTFIALSGLLIWLAILEVGMQLDKFNKLKIQEIEIKKQQLELAKKQFALDSLRFEHIRHTR